MRAHTRFAGQLAGAIAGLLAVAAIAAPAAQAVEAAHSAQAAPTTRAAHTTRTALASRTAHSIIRAARGPSGVAAPWAELENAATGAVLWSRGAQTERPMGSITKVMTAYVVLESGGSLNRLITVPKGIVSYDVGASTAGLIPGEKYTALQLLNALLIPSGCDAAYTLANAYGPGLGKFIAKMNATAKKLGLTRTHFTDPSGLPYPTGYSTYSTPRDLLSLGRDAMRLAVFSKIVAVAKYNLAASRTHAAHHWKNNNSLLMTYTGTIGIKTGGTVAAGACVLFEAKRKSKGHTTVLIGVVLHSSAWYNLGIAFSDATKILNWGFKL